MTNWSRNFWMIGKRTAASVALFALTTSTASAQYNNPYAQLNVAPAPQYGQQPQYQQPIQYAPQQAVPYMASRPAAYPTSGYGQYGPRFAMETKAELPTPAATATPAPAEAVAAPAAAPSSPMPMSMPAASNSYPTPSYSSPTYSQAPSVLSTGPAPVSYSEGYTSPAPSAGCANCNQAPAVTYSAPAPVTYSAPAPMTYSAPAPMVYNSYPATSDCGGYASGGAVTYASAGPQRQWFAGVYGLYMQRTNPGKTDLALIVNGTPAAYPYYPPSTVTVLSSSTDPDFQGGAEARIGSTFGCASDGCNCYQPYAWELGYWGLAEDNQQQVLTASPFGGGTRMYGMINFAGLEYDRDGAGSGYSYRPLNDYYDYQMPIGDPAASGANNIRVLGMRTRTSFSAQNLELNFWRFGNPGALGAAGFGGGGCGGMGPGLLGGGLGGGCNSGCNSGCNGGCSPCGGGYGGCGPVAKPQRLFVNGLMGVRYLRLDDNFQNAVQFSVDDGTGSPVAGEPAAYTSFPVGDDNVLFYDVNVDNNLVGFQLGGSVNYAITCKLSAFCDTNFGIYGNDMKVYQSVSGTGVARRIADGAVANFHANKQDVAFLGEARLGLGYQITPCWRVTGAWRVLAISGVAISGEQIPTNFANSAQVGYVDSNDSIILHGLQAGVECKF